MIWSTRRALAAVLLAVAGVACSDRTATTGDAAESDEMGPTPDVTGAARVTPRLPDTSGSAIWTYLQAERYREAWSTWPGKGELYEGQRPHGLRLTTYLNDPALQALGNRAGEMPNGAIIVKENYEPDGTLVSTTVMYKREGYDAAHNDWYFSKHEPDGTIAVGPDGNLLSGKVWSCQNCHADQAANDYIFTASLSKSPAQ